MKSISRILIMVAMLYSVSNAQFLSDYGFKLGMVSSKFETKSEKSDSYYVPFYDRRRMGPIIGLFIRYLDIGFLELESEFTYVQKGGNNKYEITTVSQPEGTGEYIIFDIQFDYLQFQTSLRPRISVNGIEIYGLFGFSLDYLLAVKNGLLTRKDLSSVVWGYLIGGGSSFSHFMNHKISFEMVYNPDVKKIYDSETLQHTNQLVTLKLGVSLRNYEE